MCAATLCAANEYVAGNACMACPQGTTNAAGDDATGADTNCDAGQEQLNLTFAAGAKVGDQLTVHVRYAFTPDTLDPADYGPTEVLLVIPVPAGLTVAGDVDSVVAVGQAAANAGKNATGAIVGQDANGRPLLRIVVSGTDPARIAPGDIARITFTQAQPGPYGFTFGAQTTVAPPGVNAMLNAQGGQIDFDDDPGPGEDGALVLEFTEMESANLAFGDFKAAVVSYRPDPADLLLDNRTRPRTFSFEIHYSPNMSLNENFDIGNYIRPLQASNSFRASYLAQPAADGWRRISIVATREVTYAPGDLFSMDGFLAAPGSEGPYQIRFQMGPNQTDYIPADDTIEKYELRGQGLSLQ
jgi:hypothetical protein